MTTPVQVKISVAQRISPSGGKHWFPRLFQMPDGSILQFNCTVDDSLEAIRQDQGSAGRLSRDGGQSWEPFTQPTHYGFPVTLSGGQVRSFSYILWHRPDGSTYGLMSDLAPGSRVWTAERESEFHLPPTTTHPNNVCGMIFDRSVFREPDGALLATMYGRFAGDTNDRSIVVRSTDSGENWEYVSTIGYDPSLPGEGLNEPVMARVADGSLLAIMRTASRSPMYQSRSTDNGLTWSPPQRLQGASVDPDICLMQNGTLACSFGRPIVNIMFSLDGSGYNWTDPIVVYDSKGDSTCYTGLREIAGGGPLGRLLLVYDTNPSGSPWEAHDNQVNMVFIEVIPGSAKAHA